MPFIIPHIFKAGEKAIAEQINENFNYLKQSLDQVNTVLNNKVETNVQEINDEIANLNTNTDAISDLIDSRDTILKLGTIVIPDPTEDGQIPTVEIELEPDKVHTAAIFANSQIILPTLEDDTKYYNCLFEFTIAQDVTLTLSSTADLLDNKYSYAQLKSAVTVNNPESTRFLEITVRTPDAVDSKKIVDSICEVSQEKIVELLGIDQVAIIRKGDIASAPSSPNTSGNIVKAIIAAFVAFAGTVVLICFLNDKINGPEDIEKYLDISVLGNIPYNQNKKKTKSK